MYTIHSLHFYFFRGWPRRSSASRLDVVNTIGEGYKELFAIIYTHTYNKVHNSKLGSSSSGSRYVPVPDRMEAYMVFAM